MASTISRRSRGLRPVFANLTATLTVNAGDNQNNRLEGGGGDDTYAFAYLWGDDVVVETVSGGDDALDFSNYTGTLAVASDGSITGSDGGTVAYDDQNAERLVGADLQIDADAQTQFMACLTKLVERGAELIDFGELGTVLPVVGQDLGDFGNIQSTSTLALSADADLAVTLGIDLTPSQPIAVAPPVLRPSLPPDGVLSGSATFEVVVINELDSGDE